jgi:hypothetical protein
MMDVNQLANAKPKGKRPWFYESKEAERVLNIALALAQELSVTRERLDTLERLLQAKGLMSQAEIDSYVPNKAVATERGLSTQAYLARVLRIISQEEQGQAEASSESLETLVDKLARE